MSKEVTSNSIDAAVTACKTDVRRAIQLCGKQDLQTLAALERLVCLLTMARRDEEAEQYSRRASSLRVTIENATGLAQQLEDSKRAVWDAELLFGADHVQVAGFLEALAVNFLRAGDHDGADVARKRAASIRSKNMLLSRACPMCSTLISKYSMGCWSCLTGKSINESCKKAATITVTQVPESISSGPDSKPTENVPLVVVAFVIFVLCLCCRAFGLPEGVVQVFGFLINVVVLGGLFGGLILLWTSLVGPPDTSPQPVLDPKRLGVLDPLVAVHIIDGDLPAGRWELCGTAIVMALPDGNLRREELNVVALRIISQQQVKDRAATAGVIAGSVLAGPVGGAIGYAVGQSNLQITAMCTLANGTKFVARMDDRVYARFCLQLPQSFR